MGGAQTDAVTVNSIRAFLFDLDGTLVDSVPDLTTAVNQLRSAWRFEPVSEERVRCWIGDGAEFDGGWWDVYVDGCEVRSLGLA